MTTSWSENKRLLSTGDVTEAELFDASAARIKADAHFKAWQWTYSSYEDATQARWRSTQPDFQAFVGMQLAVKDIYNSQTGTTEMGSPAWSGHRAGNDARVLAEFTYNGAVMLGKTKTAEFAVHALPDTLNPWDVARTPGTSSTGSAVSVALGHVPVALGTQTAGSITRPASFCSVIGFKPTQGIHPRTGILKTCDPFDTVGVFTQSLDDLLPVFETTRVRGDNYPIVERRLGQAYKHAVEGGKLRVGLVSSPFDSAEDPEVRAAINDFFAALPKDQFNLQEIDLTPELANADAIHANIYNKALSYYFQPERARGETFSPTLEEIFVHGDLVSTETYREGLLQLPPLRAAVAQKLADYDILLSPSTATPAPLRGQTERPDTSRFWTMLHLPTLSLPLFKNTTSGLPFGLQVIGARKFTDPLLFTFIKRAGLDDSALVRLPRTE